MKHEPIKKKLNIKDLAEADRPREKLLLKGTKAVSDAELLAILIGAGNQDETAVELSQRILYTVDNNLNSLGKLSVKDLTNRFKGIGEAKALTIIAALELGRRRKEADKPELNQIRSSADVYRIMHPLMADLPKEEMWVLLLNNANKVIKQIQVSTGGITGVQVDIRIIMKEALENYATAMIMCHNHPSNNRQPSQDDDSLTKRIDDACKIMNISLLDHIIITDGNYYSYQDEDRVSNLL